MARGVKARKDPAGRTAAPKRRRATEPDDLEERAEQEEQAEPVDGDADAEEANQTVLPAAASRQKERWAAQARRRAAHFARFGAAEDEEEEGNNLHTGGTEARTLGPWASARQLTEGRAEAAAARETKIAAAKQTAAEADATAKWEPKKGGSAQRRPERVGKLYGMCLALLVEHIDDVETLWGLPTDIKVQLAAAVCSARRMTAATIRLFTEGGPDEVVLPELTQLEPAALAAALAALERLELGFCGRGVSAEAVGALAGVRGGNASLPGLRSLALNDAYRLEDAGLHRLLLAAPNLERLRLANCSRLQDAAHLASLAPNLRVLDLRECRGISGESLQAGLTRLSSLQELHMDGNAEVNDELLTEVALACQLRALSISSCQAVTEAGLRGLAAGAPDLERLCADDCSKLADRALRALTAACKGLQASTDVSLRRCTKMTDTGLAALAQSGTLRSLNVALNPRVGPATIKALATRCRDSLEELDLSWCRSVPESWLGLLADTCPNLRKLTIFGCTQVTDRFLTGHSCEGLVVEGASTEKVSPLAQAKAVLILPEA